MKTHLCIDAFCGAGGFGLGLKDSGFQIVHSFDFDQRCVETLTANKKYFDHKLEVSDIREIDGDQLLAKLGLAKGELSLLAGGPPCQGFSMQRTVGADDDDRNLLVHHYGSLIEKVLPKFFIMENVVGLGGKRGKKILSDFLEKMESLGYSINHDVLDAQNYGVPQRRKRVIVVGEYQLTPGKTFYKWPIFSDSPSPTVFSTIGHLPAPPEDYKDHPLYPGHRADRLSEKNKMRLQALKGGQGRTNLPDELVADCHKLPAEKIGHRNVYGRMDWDDVAPTITARFDSFTRGKFGHPEQIRTISLYEGALLQTFPDDYKFVGNKVEVARQIGNAVPPLFAKAIGQSVLDALRLMDEEKDELRRTCA